MTITQITHFIAVAETLSFTQAANMLYVSQPAISKSISKLEEHFGFKLFERNENTLMLTAAGAKIYEFLSNTSESYRTIIDDIRSTLDHPSTLVRIGCPETWNPGHFYGIIENHFKKNHPHIKLSIECYKLSELITRLHTDKLDIILTHDFFIPTLPNISINDLTPSNFGILYSKRHFPNVTSVQDFSKTPFLLFDNDIEKRFSAVIRTLCSEYNISPKIINCIQPSSALFNAACGKGIMLFSSWDSAIANSTFGFLPLEQVMPVKIIHFTDNGIPNLSNYVEEIKSLFAKP